MTMAEHEYKTLIYQKDKEVPHIVYITINRPEKKNAISIGPQEVTGELQDAVRRADNDNEVKVVIFKGQGENFSAGFDLSQVYRVYGGTPGVRPPQATRLRIDEDSVIGMPGSILGCKKVTIAQIRGWCIEAGMYIIESCDIAIASKDAKFAHRGQRLAFGGMPFMPLELIMGHSKKITELLITGRTIMAEEAELAGIITKSVEPEDLEEEVYNLAKAISLLPRDAIAIGKLCRRHAYDSMGATSLMSGITYHTLGTNLTYGEDEKDRVFIRDREKMGPRDAFHKLHIAFEQALNKTKYFKSYDGD
jgi:enoyl-CoA hydratase